MGPPQDMTATEADSTRSSAYFAFGLPLPPTDLAVSERQGWMGGNAPNPAAFNLWEGVLAAAGGQAPGKQPAWRIWVAVVHLPVLAQLRIAHAHVCLQ